MERRLKARTQFHEGVRIESLQRVNLHEHTSPRTCQRCYAEKPDGVDRRQECHDDCGGCGQPKEYTPAMRKRVGMIAAFRAADSVAGSSTNAGQAPAAWAPSDAGP
jgi:hypothetical protein